MKELIKKLYKNDVVRSVFFGGCTTMVNLVSFYILNDMLGKFATQFVVLVLNYIFSKFLVFTTGKK